MKLIRFSMMFLFAVIPLHAALANHSAGSAVSIENVAPDSLPVSYFTANAGQVANRNIRFYLSAGGFQAGFADSAALFSLTEAPALSPASTARRKKP